MKQFRKGDIDAVKLFRSDFPYAAKKVLNINTSWWQRHWLKGINTASISYIIGARGAGKSYTLALYCVLTALLHPKEKVGIISNSYRQAQMIFTAVCDILDGSEHAKACITKQPTVGLNRCYVEFANKSTIIALPLGDGSKIRSARFFTLVIDEYQDIDQEIIDVVILPFLNVQKNPVTGMLVESRHTEEKTNKNRLIIASTARHKYNPAYTKYLYIRNQYEDGNPVYFHSTITLDDLRTLPGWINEEIVKLEEETMSPVQFRMENFGEWADTGNGFFDPMLCEAMKDLNTKFLNEPIEGHHYCIGVDPAKSSANFTIYMLDWDGEFAKLVFAQAYNKDETNLAIETIKYLQSKFNAWVYMDARGGGIWVSDELMKTEISNSFGGVQLLEGIPYNKLILVQTAHPLIDNMNWALKAGIENGKIKVPMVVDEKFQNQAQISHIDKQHQEINELISELQSIVQKQLEKEVQYNTESKNAMKDRYCAFMYAYWGIVENYIAKEYDEDKLYMAVV
jgi:hypothetical protein